MANKEVDWDALINVAEDILAFQVIPHASSLTAQFLVSREQYDWYYLNIRRPFWDVFGRHMNSVFAILHTGLGAASYLIYQSEKCDWLLKATPLVLCGVQIVFDFAWRPLYFNQKNWDRAFRHSVACVLLSCTVSSTYSRVDPLAGYLIVPYFLWWIYLTTVVWYVRLVNDPAEPWKRLSFGGSALLRRPTTTPAGSVSDWLERLMDDLPYYARHAGQVRDSVVETVAVMLEDNPAVTDREDHFVDGASFINTSLVVVGALSIFVVVLST